MSRLRNIRSSSSDSELQKAKKFMFLSIKAIPAYFDESKNCP